MYCALKMKHLAVHLVASASETRPCQIMNIYFILANITITIFMVNEGLKALKCKGYTKVMNHTVLHHKDNEACRCNRFSFQTL
jgi:hypothetical protein